MRLLAGFALAMCFAAPAFAQNPPMLAYPAMMHAGKAYAVRVGSTGKIVKCQPIDAAGGDTAAACAALTAKGVPATVTPARSTSDPASWVTDNDYPGAALRAEASGTVHFLFEVDETGRVANCTVSQSSGNASIDSAVCAAIVARARFTPATYKGQPVRAVGASHARMEFNQ
jgi:TonB family protein